MIQKQEQGLQINHVKIDNDWYLIPVSEHDKQIIFSIKNNNKAIIKTTQTLNNLQKAKQKIKRVYSQISQIRAYQKTQKKQKNINNLKQQTETYLKNELKTTHKTKKIAKKNNTIDTYFKKNQHSGTGQSDRENAGHDNLGQSLKRAVQLCEQINDKPVMPKQQKNSAQQQIWHQEQDKFLIEAFQTNTTTNISILKRYKSLKSIKNRIKTLKLNTTNQNLQNFIKK